MNELVAAAGQFKDLAFEGLAELVKMGLNEAIEIVVKQTSKPEELNLIVTNSALPAAMDSMIKYFADDLIQAHVCAELAPLFQTLPNPDEEKKLLKTLFDIAKREAPLFNFTKENEGSFNKIVIFRINEIVELLTSIKKKYPQKTSLKLTKATIAIIKEYYKYDTKSKENNPHFAAFIDVALRTKEFGTLMPRLFNHDSIRNMMSKLITSSVQNYRKSYQPGLNEANRLIKEKYLHEEVIEKLITPKPSLESLVSDIRDLKGKIDKLEKEIENENNVLLRQEKGLKLEELNKELSAKTVERTNVATENENHKQELIDAKKLFNNVDKMDAWPMTPCMFLNR